MLLLCKARQQADRQTHTHTCTLDETGTFFANNSLCVMDTENFIVGDIAVVLSVVLAVAILLFFEKLHFNLTVILK